MLSDSRPTTIWDLACGTKAHDMATRVSSHGCHQDTISVDFGGRVSLEAKSHVLEQHGSGCRALLVLIQSSKWEPSKWHLNLSSCLSMANC